jgi:hypothetical protein
MKTAAKSYNESLQTFKEMYRASGELWPADIRTIAGWVIQRGLWKPSSRSAVSILARDLGQALRVEYMTDVQGRRIRKMHARKLSEELPDGKYVQKTLWDDITTAEPEHMHISFQQRRKMVLGDCHQLKTDLDSYNENWNTKQEIQLSWDFTEDLAELDLPTHYEGDDFGGVVDEDDGED